MSRPIEAVLAALEKADKRPRRSGQGWTACCPAHDDRTPSLSIREAEDGTVLLRCHANAGCTAKAVIHAVGLRLADLFPQPKGLDHVLSPSVRHAQLTNARLARVQASAPPPEPIPPVPDKALLDRILEHSLSAWGTWPDWNVSLDAVPFLAKRGILSEVARAHGVGFMPWIRFKGWKRAMPNVWVIPIKDESGCVLALKLHRENAPKGRPKCLWAPLGTQPQGSPRHGWATLWPPPEMYFPNEQWEERAGFLEFHVGLSRHAAEHRAHCEIAKALPWLYLLPGELKALAAIGAGHHATSPTAGESFKWTPGTVARLADRRVALVFDDDPAGHRFRDSAIQALRSHVAALKVLTLGLKGVAAP